MPNVSMPSIPGLRKTQHAEGENAVEGALEQAVEAQPTQNANERDEDDRSR